MPDDFPLYAPSEEHRTIRKVVRELAEDKIAPYAAAVDEEARYPDEAAEALLAADFHAPHVPEQYGGAGADALATVIVSSSYFDIQLYAGVYERTARSGPRGCRCAALA